MRLSVHQSAEYAASWRRSRSVCIQYGGHPFGLLTDVPRWRTMSSNDYLTNQNEHQAHTPAEEAWPSQFRMKSDNKQPNAHTTLDALRPTAAAMERCVRL